MTTNEETWQRAFRSQFPVTAQCTYLDTAYDCGGTLWGAASAARYFTDWEGGAVRNERGGPGRAILFRTLDETRELLCRLVGAASADRIAFTRNTNEGINAILQGFAFRPGDNIVTDSQEHPSVLMPCLNAGRTRGVDVRIVPVPEDARITPESLIEASDAHTRIIAVSHVQSATGYRIDLRKLGTLCKARGIFLVVDAIQSLGLFPFEADAWHVSAVSAASYKGLCAGNSTAFTCYTPELLAHIWPVYTAAGPFMTTQKGEDGRYELNCKDMKKARKMENSSLDNIGIYVLHDALKHILEIGTDRIGAHVMRLYDAMYDGLSTLGFDLVTPKNADEHLGILSLRTAHLNELFDYFRSKNICLSISADTYIRFSLGGFNNDADVQALLYAAKDCPFR